MYNIHYNKILYQDICIKCIDYTHIIKHIYKIVISRIYINYSIIITNYLL